MLFEEQKLWYIQNFQNDINLPDMLKSIDWTIESLNDVKVKFSD